MHRLFLLAMVDFLPIFGAETNNKFLKKESLAGYQHRFMLPVDHTQTPQYNLMCTIPRGFKSLQSLEEFGRPTSYMIEYTPSTSNLEF